jgi:hypothetical protein
MRPGMRQSSLATVVQTKAAAAFDIPIFTLALLSAVAQLWIVKRRDAPLSALSQLA